MGAVLTHPYAVSSVFEVRHADAAGIVSLRAILPLPRSACVLFALRAAGQAVGVFISFGNGTAARSATTPLAHFGSLRSAVIMRENRGKQIYWQENVLREYANANFPRNP